MVQKTVEAEIDVDGTVTLLEPLRVEVKTKALVMLLENGEGAGRGNISSTMELIQSSEFKNRRSYPVGQIEAQIEEARNSWE